MPLIFKDTVEDIIVFYMKKILFVCLGNICRSPASEAVMKSKLKKAGREAEFYVDSAGIYGGHSGAYPDVRMRKHAAKRGYELEHRARQFYASADFSEFDIIIGMDRQNIADLKRLAVTDEERAKIYAMTDFCRVNTIYREVPDPYYEGPDGFELVLDLLEDAVEGLIEKQ